MSANGLVIPAAIAFSYLLGSVPTGLWLGLKLRNIDIREHGSRNIGATNTLRVLGKKLGAITLAMDVLKGWLPVAAALWLNVWDYLPILCGLAAILGHTFSVFLRFRGGKGVATSTGVFLGLAPMPTLIAALVFGVVVAATRISGLTCAAGSWRIVSCSASSALARSEGRFAITAIR